MGRIKYNEDEIREYAKNHTRNECSNHFGMTLSSVNHYFARHSIKHLLEKNANGKRNTKLYNSWRGMKERCTNKNHYAYKYYGGRGIKLFPDWYKFINFDSWAMQNGYKEGLTIDRINVDGDYCPSNCRWVSFEEQSKNKRNNKLITYKGKTQTMKDWSEELNISYGKLSDRLGKLGWSVERSLEVK